MRTASSTPEAIREDVRVYLDVLHELGADYADELTASFMDKVTPLPPPTPARVPGLILAMLLGAGIPLTAIAGTSAELPGIAAVWLGLVAMAWLSRRPAVPAATPKPARSAAPCPAGPPVHTTGAGAGSLLVTILVAACQIAVIVAVQLTRLTVALMWLLIRVAYAGCAALVRLIAQSRREALRPGSTAA